MCRIISAINGVQFTTTISFVLFVSIHLLYRHFMLFSCFI